MYTAFRSYRCGVVIQDTCPRWEKAMMSIGSDATVPQEAASSQRRRNGFEPVSRIQAACVLSSSRASTFNTHSSTSEPEYQTHREGFADGSAATIISSVATTAT